MGDKQVNVSNWLVGFATILLLGLLVVLVVSLLA